MTRDSFHLAVECTKAVEDGQVDITLQKMLVLVLAADGHQLLGQRLQLCQGRKIAVDIGPAATAALDNPPQNEFGFDREPGFGKSLAHIILSGQIKQCLNSRLIGAGPDQVGPGSVSEQETDCIENNRLARAGFAG